MDLIRNLYARFRVLIHEVAKFGVVGILAFLITIGLSNWLRFGKGLGPATSVTIATVIATVFSYLGNKLWAFRHRKGSQLRRETILFFVFNGIGLLIQLAFVSFTSHVLGYNDKFSYNVANILGIGVATLFRLYTYRRWVFIVTDEELAQAGQLEPETSST